MNSQQMLKPHLRRFLVGGAVRDYLMGLQPKDRDWVLVGATQQDVDDMIAQGYEWVGADFPVLLHPTTKEEHALARVERKVGVGYNGFECDTEGVTIEQDLSRRDFTMNAIAWETTYDWPWREEDLIDPFNGREDIKNKIIRHTTYAFTEDPLRALRAARFAARLCFTIHLDTKKLIKDMGVAGELEHLTNERVWLEFKKAFSGPNPSMFYYHLYKLGIVEHCKVLRDVLPADLYAPNSYAVCSNIRHLPEEDRYELGLAVLAKNVDVPALTARTKRAHKNYHLLVDDGVNWFNPGARYVVDTIVQIGGLREGTAFDDALKCLTLREAQWEPMYVRELLLEARKVMAEVKADQFTHLTGRELGEAMIQERVKRVELLLVQ